MPPERIKIRQARADDIAAIGRIVVQSWRLAFEGLVSSDFLSSMSEEHQRRRHEQTFSRKGVVYYVSVTEDDDPVGFASCGPGRRPARAIQRELYAIYLMPHFQRQGIGRSLFERVVTDLALTGRPRLFLTTLAVSPNRPFYAKLGGNEAEAESVKLGDEMYRQIAFVWTNLSTLEEKSE